MSIFSQANGPNGKPYCVYGNLCSPARCRCWIAAQGRTLRRNTHSLAFLYAQQFSIICLRRSIYYIYVIHLRNLASKPLVFPIFFFLLACLLRFFSEAFLLSIRTRLTFFYRILGIHLLLVNVIQSSATRKIF